MDVLVSADDVAERLGDAGFQLIDCRWKLGEPGAGERLFRASRIPGAAFLDVDTDLSAPPGERGRHPLPVAADFQTAARRAGINDGDMVVAYDTAGEGGAARCWWLFRHFGHDRVGILDGGFSGWPSDLDGGAPDEPPPGDFTARERDDDIASIDEVRAGGGRLIDARARERYRGDVEPVDHLAGHIPGADNVPFATLMRSGRFAPADELRAALGDTDDSVAYCGSGVSACVLIAAAAHAGATLPRLYPGSWSEWSQTFRGNL